MENISLRLAARNENFFKNKPYEYESNFSVSLRKKKRANNLAIKRSLITDDNQEVYIKHLQTLNILLSSNFTFFNLAPILNSLIQEFERISYIHPEPINSANFITNIFKILNNEFSPIFHLEISYIVYLLIEKSPSSTVLSLLSNGIMPYLIKILDTLNVNIIEYLMLALGLLSVNIEKGAEYVINSGYLNKLKSIFIKISSQDELKSLLAWTIANLARKDSHISIKDSSFIIKFVTKYLLSSLPKIQYEILRMFCGISYRTSNYVQLLFEFNIHKYCIELCGNNDELIQITAIKILGNMMVHFTSYIQILLNLGIVEILYENIAKSTLVKLEIFWALANLTNGMAGQIAAVVEHRILERIFQGLIDHDSRIKTEASIIIRNIITKGCNQSLNLLINSNIFNYLKIGMEDNNKTIISNCIISTIILLRNSQPDPILLLDSGVLPILESNLYKSNLPLGDFILDFFTSIENS